MNIYIGCSGWHYLHWRSQFYPAEAKPVDFLSLYLKHFDTVEINNSFYRLPSPSTLMNWKNTVPSDFKFSVKASRFITHNKKLKDSADSFALFFNRIALLGDSLGPILFQLSPQWKYNGERLKEFLSQLPLGNKYVFEFRNHDWMREEAFVLLQKYQATFCIHDMAGSQTPEILTSKTAYVRFHGPKGTYEGGYSGAILKHWAYKIIEWRKNNIQSYIYFNNDIGGFAPKDALRLKRLINDLTA
jgi:uncharacterized protein YecE (DUF72 family)